MLSAFAVVNIAVPNSDMAIRYVFYKNPTFPAVIPIVRKKTNSKRSLELEGTEFNKDKMKIILIYIL